MSGVVVWMHPSDLDPPHGLEMDWEHDVAKVEMLFNAFTTEGFDRSHAALVGYPLAGRVQLLSGTHRHRAASLIGMSLPIVLWLRSDVEAAWGQLEAWMKVIKDHPVSELERWTRDDLDGVAGRDDDGDATCVSRMEIATGAKATTS